MLLKKIVIKGHSMEPTFPHNSTLIISSIPYFFSKPKAGDVVLVKRKKLLVKRIDKISRGLYFVTGDNKEESTDSRDFGWISRNEIIGKMIYKFNS